MKVKTSLIFISFIVCSAFVCFQPVLFTVPKKWPKPEYDFSKNPLTTDGVLLGRVLFYDPILSADNSTSCASCHSPYNAFAHVDHALSHGINNRIGKRNAPALMNLAWQKALMWDGAIHHLDVQALAPISHPDEMGETIEHVVEKLKGSTLYPALFYRAYGDSLITGEGTLKALSQFMLTLVSANSKYDSVMRNAAKFTAQETRGYRLFKPLCGTCHTEPLFTNNRFENNGLTPDPTLNDAGRMKISRDPKDSLKFKVPTLRNIEFTYPYMHDGRFKTLQEVLKHYTSGIQKSGTLAPQFDKPIALNSNEKVDLIAFLLTLSDRHFLFDPDHSFPKNILNQGKK